VTKEISLTLKESLAENFKHLKSIVLIFEKKKTKLFETYNFFQILL